MTYDELEGLVAQGDPMAVAEALSPLSEAERKKLSVGVGKLYREIEGGAWNYEKIPHGTASGAYTSKPITAPLKRLANAIANKDVTIDHQLAAAKIAALGVCPITVTKKIDGRMRFNREDTFALVKVLTDRKPDWANNWLDAKLSSEWSEIGWRPHRELIKNGVVKKPDTDDYIRFLATHKGGDYRYGKFDDYRPMSEAAVAEPDLLDDIWRLFEVDTGAFLYCWDQKPIPKPNLPPQSPRQLRGLAGHDPEPDAFGTS